MGRLQRFFFDSLPAYFYHYDTYKDANKEGLLQRFLSVLQQESEVDEEAIRNMLTAVFPETAKREHLDYIAYALGLPPLLVLDNDQVFRKVLAHSIAMYRYKGTIEGLRRFFRIWGFNVTITVTSPDKILYDTGLKYDDIYYYDQSCSKCISVDILLMPFTQPAHDALNDPDFPDRVVGALNSMAPIFWRSVTINSSIAYLVNEDAYIITSDRGRLIAFK